MFYQHLKGPMEAMLFAAGDPLKPERLSELLDIPIEHVLEMLQKGAAVSPELLMSENDIELMSDLANDREPAEAEAAQLEQLIADELV